MGSSGRTRRHRMQESELVDPFLALLHMLAWVHPTRGLVQDGVHDNADEGTRRDIAPALDWTYHAGTILASACNWTMEFTDPAVSEEAPQVYAIIASVYVGFYVFMTAFMRMPGRIWKPYPEKEISL